MYLTKLKVANAKHSVTAHKTEARSFEQAQAALIHLESQGCSPMDRWGVPKKGEEDKMHSLGIGNH